MKYLKKWLSLLLAGALIVTSLTACGAGTAYISVLIDQMQSQLTNMTVESDAELQRALQVVAGSGSTDETVLTQDLIEELNLTDVVPFTLVGLRNARAGSSAVDVVYREGNNPNAAIDSAATRWLDVLRYLHSGRYIVHVALVQKNSSYAFAIHVQVERSGNSGDDDDVDNDNDNIIDRGYRPLQVSVDCKDYRIVRNDGLENLVDDLAALGDKTGNSGLILTADITLDCDVALEKDWAPIGYRSEYNATFDGNGHTISNLKADNYLYQGLIGKIGKSGAVKNLTLEKPYADSLDPSETYGNYAGAVTGENFGTIENCTIKDAQITGASYVGGVAGFNTSSGTIKNCSVIGGTITGSSCVGGVAGYNSNEVSECKSTADIEGSIGMLGGVVGKNIKKGTVKHCTSTGDVTYTGDGGRDNYSNRIGGGIVGENEDGKIIACYRKSGNVGPFYEAGGIVGENDGGEVIACYHSGGDVSSIDYLGNEWNTAGGIVGDNDDGKVIACYHSGGNVTFTPGLNGWLNYVGGIVGKSYERENIIACYYINNNNYKTKLGTEVDGDDTTWQDAEEAMNKAASGCGWTYSGASKDNPPTLPEVNPQ